VVEVLSHIGDFRMMDFRDRDDVTRAGIDGLSAEHTHPGRTSPADPNYGVTSG
jgi:hypothetical protein